MDPFTTAIALTALVVTGRLGSLLISGFFERRSLKREGDSDDPRIGELQEDHRQLEARLERLEEEVTFFRELHKPEDPARLPKPESNHRDG